MTGKHRTFNLKTERPYAVGTKFKLERIVKEEYETHKHIVRVSAKRGNANDVYILYAAEPKKYLNQLVEVERVRPDFMHNTYYLKPAGEKSEFRRVSY